MKTKYILKPLVILLFVLTASAQQGINYKAMIKDANGDAIANTAITVQFTILENGTTDVFQESHNPTTDANGIIIVNIGEGTLISGDFNAIDWGSNSHFLKTEIDKGEGLIDMGTTQFMAVPYSKFAERAQNVDLLQAQITDLNERIIQIENAIIHIEKAFVGQYRAGGIVFWVDPADETHGMVCALEDQSDVIQWYNSEYIITGAQGTSIGSGSSNTNSIIEVQGPVETDYAAGLARNYSGGGFNDWFLPSRDELNEIYVNRMIVNSAIELRGGSLLVDETYWSSSEYIVEGTQNDGLLYVWGQNFENGIAERYNKEWDGFSTRAIRAF